MESYRAKGKLKARMLKARAHSLKSHDQRHFQAKGKMLKASTEPSKEHPCGNLGSKTDPCKLKARMLKARAEPSSHNPFEKP